MSATKHPELMEPMTAQMPDTTLWFICIIAFVCMAHFIYTATMSEEAQSARALRKLRRDINRRRSFQDKYLDKLSDTEI